MLTANILKPNTNKKSLKAFGVGCGPESFRGGAWGVGFLKLLEYLLLLALCSLLYAPGHAFAF